MSLSTPIKRPPRFFLIFIQTSRLPLNKLDRKQFQSFKALKKIQISILKTNIYNFRRWRNHQRLIFSRLKHKSSENLLKTKLHAMVLCCLNIYTLHLPDFFTIPIISCQNLPQLQVIRPSYFSNSFSSLWM